MAPNRLSALTVLRRVAVLQALLIVPEALGFVLVPIRDVQSYRRGVVQDPTGDLGPWIVPLVLGIIAFCLLGVAAYLVLGLALPLCARRLQHPYAFRILVGLETVVWLLPLVGPLPAVPATIVSGVLLITGLLALTLLWLPALRRRTPPIPSPDAATHVPGPHRAARPASARRH